MTKQAMKFRVRDEEHSKAIQEKLFELGYRWGVSEYAVVELTDKPFLFADDDKSITYCGNGEDKYFDAHRNTEYVLQDGEIVPLSEAGVMSLKLSPNSNDKITPEDISPKPVKVVSTGGSSSYYQLTITNKAGESIAVETGDILRALVGNDYDLSNIVKACRRMYEASQGRGKEGASIEYDSRKIIYFANEFKHWNKDK